MKASQGQVGRVFIIRLEDGDIIPGSIEHFAAENGVTIGQVILLGGIGGGEVVVGPRNSQARPPDPMLLPVDGAHEVLAVGVLAPNHEGKPILHIHGALGRSGNTITGCLRPGVSTWLVGEVILYEILGASAARLIDPDSGFELLELEGKSQ
ncbi:MAG: PPC domain-containing DNA-binding protein [Dehalococcoidales bacterium]